MIHERKYFALRERSTGRLLPTAQRTSMTHVEFGDNGAPRLFTRHNAAVNALMCWRMGHWRLTGDDDRIYPEPSLTSRNKQIADRRAVVEVDIVTVELKLS